MEDPDVTIPVGVVDCTVTVTVTEDTSGCSPIADLVIAVTQGPDGDAGGPYSVCGDGGLIQLDGTGAPVAGGALTYSWATDIPGATFIPDNTVEDPEIDVPPGSADGTVTLSITEDTTGCTRVVEAGLTISPAPAEVSAIGDPVKFTFSKNGTNLEMEYGTAADAALYRISRGEIGTWYSHLTDDAAGIGVCDNGLNTTYTDPDDLDETGDFYYLVVAVSANGCEGSYGPDSDMNERPARTPTASCP